LALGSAGGCHWLARSSRARADVELAPGAHRFVTLRLSPEAAAAPPPARAPAGPHDRAGARAVRWPAWLAFGAGAAGLAAGSAFGALALGARSRLEDDCNGGRQCPSSSQPDIDALGRNAWLSNVGFGLGALGLGLGAYLALAPPRHAPPAAGATGRPRLGASAGGLVVTF
jgi:hypothetical protein